MKYMGSKARFAKEIYKVICERTPRNGRAWVEPFAGGMNMISNIPAEDGPRYANDCNFYLIELFKALVNGWIPPQNVSKELYYDCKNNIEKYEPYFIGYIGFNCSYSGIWFGSYAGSTKTAINTVRDYQEEAFKNVTKQIEKMKDVLFCNTTFENLNEILPKESIIYCDPPYEGTSKYKDDLNHEKFWQWVRELSADFDVYVSEYNAPDDFECIWQKEAKSSLSANGKQGGNKKSIEKLFVYKG